MKNSLLKNSIFKSLLSICNIVIPLLIGPYVTHLLDVNQYGAFNKVIAELNVFLVFATFGIYTYGVKEISKVRDNPEKLKKTSSSLFTISLITNFIVMAIYLVYSFVFSSGITRTIYIISSIQLIANSIYLEFINEALENYNFITYKTLIVKVFYLLFIFLLVKKSDDIIVYSIIYSVVVFVNNLASFIYLNKKLGFDFKSIEIKKHLKPLFIVFLIGSVEVLYFQLDKVLLGKLISDVSVSIYQIPYMIMSMIITIPTAIVSVSIPRLSNIYALEGKEQYQNKLNDILSYFLIFLLPVCFGVFSISKEVVLLYAGEKYIQSVNLLRVFSLARIFVGLESFMTLLIIYINNKEKKLLYIFGGIGLMNLADDLLLYGFKIFTPLTAALSTSILYILLILVEYYYIKKDVKTRISILNKKNLSYFFLSFCFILISILVDMLNFSIIYSMFLKICLCGLMYFSVLLFIKDSIVLNVLGKMLKIIKR